MGIYAGDAPSLFEVNGQLLTYDEYEFWKFMGKPGPLQFARQLLARKRSRMAYENVNKQTPKPSFTPEAQHEPRRLPTQEDQDRFSGNNRKFIESERAVTGSTVRLARHCRACGDALPPNANYCISCRAPVV